MRLKLAGPVARAVVNAAYEQNIEHRELHGKVEYLVAHGIVSSLDGRRVVIGSEHFVIEDEKVEISSRQKARIAHELEGLSPSIGKHQRKTHPLFTCAYAHGIKAGLNSPKEVR